MLARLGCGHRGLQFGDAFDQSRDEVMGAAQFFGATHQLRPKKRNLIIRCVTEVLRFSTEIVRCVLRWRFGSGTDANQRLPRFSARSVPLLIRCRAAS